MDLHIRVAAPMRGGMEVLFGEGAVLLLGRKNGREGASGGVSGGREGGSSVWVRISGLIPLFLAAPD